MRPPIVADGAVYYLGSGRHLCADLATGSVRWERQAGSELSSPVFADGKLFVYEHNGKNLVAVEASPDAYLRLAEIEVRALRCASPAISDGKLIVREGAAVACYALKDHQE